MVVCGAAGAALWALIPGILKAFGRTNEIITSLMLNYVAGLLLTYMIFDSASPWRDISTVQTQSFPAVARAAAQPVLADDPSRRDHDPVRVHPRLWRRRARFGCSSA